MDLEGQGQIKTIVEQHGRDGVIAVLGATAPESLRMIAETLMGGDPSYAGPLTGVALGIPSYHILERAIAGQVAPAVYERELALTASVTDVAELVKPLEQVRGGRE